MIVSGLIFASLVFFAQPAGSASPLCAAASAGNAADVRALLDHGASPNLIDDDGRAPLHCAASLMTRSATPQSDYLAVARLLLDRSADPNLRDASGRTPLLVALEGAASEYKVIGADEDLARLLLDRGASVDAQDKEGWSPLHRAASLWATQPALLPLLLSHHADANARLADGRTPLMLAVRIGKTERLAPLLGAGAKIDAADSQGQTALMIAAQVTWDDAAAEMLTLLLARGADPNLADSQGRTAADLAAVSGRLARVELLLSKGANAPNRPAFLARARNFALWREISEGSADSAQSLLAEGADANFRGPDGRTLLMAAAGMNSKVLLLLNHGATVDARTANGDTALMFAADRYDAASVKLLLARGADPNGVDAAGNSVLIRAAASRQDWREEREPLVEMLLSAQADVNRANASGVTALMLMAGAGNPAFTALLERKPSIDARDSDGNTALLYAARHAVRGAQFEALAALVARRAAVNLTNRRGETALILSATQFIPDAVHLLLEHHADIDAKTNEGRTALMRAIDAPKDFDNEHGIVYSPKIAQLLIDSGAQVNVRDNQGNTALSLALSRGYSETAAALRRAGAK